MSLFPRSPEDGSGQANDNSEKAREKKEQERIQEEYRQKRLKEIQREEKKEQIAKRLQEIAEQKSDGKDEAKVERQRQEKKASVELKKDPRYYQIAGLLLGNLERQILQRMKDDKETISEDKLDLETQLAINLIEARSNPESEERIIKEIAIATLKREQALYKALALIQKQTGIKGDIAASGILTTVKTKIEDAFNNRKKAIQATEHSEEAKKITLKEEAEQKEDEKSHKPEDILIQNAARHRQVQKIQRQIKKINSLKGQKRANKELGLTGHETEEELKQKIEQLEALSAEILDEQTEIITKLELNLGPDATSGPEGVRGFIQAQKDKIRKVADAPTTLTSEQKRLGTLLTITDFDNLTQEQKEALTHPETLGRLVLLSQEKRKEAADSIDSMGETGEVLSQAFEAYEKWRFEGNEDERIQAAAEDFYDMVIRLDAQEFTKLDMYNILAGYNLADIDFSQITSYKDDEIEKATKISLAESNSNYRKVQALIEKVQTIKAQFEATDLLLNPAEENSERQQEAHRKVLESISNVISENKSKNLFQGLEQNTLEIKQTATGLSIVIRPFELQDKEKLKSILTAMGITDAQDIKRIEEQGLGATINAKQLKEFNNFVDAKTGKVVQPSVQILILPNEPVSEFDEYMIGHHEMNDYLMQEMFLSKELKNLASGENEKEAIRALRELGSRILDGRVANAFKRDGEDLTFLNDLYISKENNTYKQELSKLIALVETIIKDQRPKGTDKAGVQDYYKEQELRSRLINDIMSHLSSTQPGNSTADFLNKLIINIEKKYDAKVSNWTSRWDDGRQLNYASSDKFMFSTPTGDPAITLEKRQQIVPRTDSTNIPNKSYREGAFYGQFGLHPKRYPDLYGPIHTSSLNQTWIYANDKTRGIPIKTLIPGFNKIPILNRAVGWIPLPVPVSYALRRSIGSGIARSTNPRVRELSYYLGTDYLGSKPEKMFGEYVNKKMEKTLKEQAPGYLASRAIPEGRDARPQSLQMDIYEGLAGKNLQWLQAVGDDAGFDPMAMIRMLGNSQIGVRYEFSQTQSGQPALQFKREMRDLMAIKSVKDDSFGGYKNEKELQKKLFKKANFSYQKDHLGYKKSDPVSPYKGLFKGLAFSWFKKPVAQGQLEAEQFFKKKQTRTQMERTRGHEKFGWMDMVGSEYKNYLEQRDGYVGLATLEAEHEHFKNNPVIIDKGGKPQVIEEDYNLYSLVNLLHRADQMIGDKEKAWHINTTGKAIKMTFRERGQKKTVTILPNEPLVDMHGNLIPDVIHLKKDAKTGEVVINKYGTIELDETKDEENAPYWQRLVGDRLNPRLRYLKINSQAGKQFAIQNFGGNGELDDGFDEDNVIIQTAPLKEAIFRNRFQLFERQLREGLPPDKRYKMRYDGNKPVIDFKEDIFERDADGNRRKDPATGKFQISEKFKQAYAKIHSEVIKDGRPIIPPWNPAMTHMSEQELSEFLENNVLGLTGGKRFLPVDRPMSEFMHMDLDDPSWENQWRFELEGIPPKSDEEVTAIMEVVTGGMEALEDRFNKGANFLQQWQTAMYHSQVYERIAYDKIGYYKGLKQHIKWWTNIGLVANGILLASEITFMPAIISPAIFYSFLAILMARVIAKPWAEKQEKTWKARRIKAIEVSNRIKDMDAVFQKALAGDSPVEYELNKMHLTMEQIIYWLEDMATTDPPDDWFPEDDAVINFLGKILGGSYEKMKELSKGK